MIELTIFSSFWCGSKPKYYS